MKLNKNTQQIDFDWYGGKDVVYPSIENFERYFLYKDGEVIINGVDKNTFDKEILNLTKIDLNDLRINSPKKALQKLGYVYQKSISDEYNKINEQNNLIIRERNEKFYTDLLEDFGLKNHPKKDKILSYINNRYSFSLSEIYYGMFNLVELLV